MSESKRESGSEDPNQPQHSLFYSVNHIASTNKILVRLWASRFEIRNSLNKNEVVKLSRYLEFAKTNYSHRNSKFTSETFEVLQLNSCQSSTSLLKSYLNVFRRLLLIAFSLQEILCVSFSKFGDRFFGSRNLYDIFNSSVKLCSLLW